MTGEGVARVGTPIVFIGWALTIGWPHALFSSAVLAVGAAMYAVSTALLARNARGAGRAIYGALTLVALVLAVLVLVPADDRPQYGLGIATALIGALLVVGKLKRAL